MDVYKTIDRRCTQKGFGTCARGKNLDFLGPCQAANASTFDLVPTMGNFVDNVHMVNALILPTSSRVQWASKNHLNIIDAFAIDIEDHKSERRSESVLLHF